MSIVINTSAELEALISKYKHQSKSIGFVPTMGGLHQGHLSLVSKAKRKAEIVVVSIFVNPTQFGAGEDLDKYPQTFERDKQLLDEQGVDVIFAPTGDEIYPQGLESDVEPGELANILCGASRPGHFKGVVQVVKRLFELVRPDVAVFGEKDYQQLMIIKAMVKRYQLPVHIESGAIVREPSGLAMSTRNQYLTESEKETAAKLYQLMKKAQQRLQSGQSVANAKAQAQRTLSEYFQVDYVEILDANTLRQTTDTSQRIAILCAVFLGSTRLIDNLIFGR